LWPSSRNTWVCLIKEAPSSRSLVWLPLPSTAGWERWSSRQKLFRTAPPVGHMFFPTFAFHFSRPLLSLDLSRPLMVRRSSLCLWMLVDGLFLPDILYWPQGLIEANVLELTLFKRNDGAFLQILLSQYRFPPSPFFLSVPFTLLQQSKPP